MNTQPQKTRNFRWWAIRVILFLLISPLIMLAFIFANNQIASARDKESFAPPGEMVNLGDHSLHLYCQGEGSPTVILEAGARSWSVIWSLVQPEIAQSTRVCSYDRAGFGWSEPGPQPRTAEQITTELHTLLTNAGIEGPYIMVGHSFGGILVRVFTDHYPDEVAGMVLIDSTHPDQAARLPVDYTGAFEAEMGKFQLYATLAHLGILRLAIEQNVPTWTLPEDVIPAYFSIMSRPEFYETDVAESSVFAESLAQGSGTADLGDKPLIVLRAGLFDEEVASYPGVDEDAYKSTRITLQEELAALSTNSRLVVAENSGHIIQLYQPELVIDAVLQVIEMSGGA